MSPLILVTLATLFYAGYNLFVKVSGDHVPETASSTILATVSIQCAALGTSIGFLVYLHSREVPIFGLSNATYAWAVAAGVCIGFAEIAYLYLFSGLAESNQSVRASVVIPVVVGGTILITALVSILVFKEPVGWLQSAGMVLIAVGVVSVFAGAGSGAH